MWKIRFCDMILLWNVRFLLAKLAENFKNDFDVTFQVAIN